VFGSIRHDFTSSLTSIRSTIFKYLEAKCGEVCNTGIPVAVFYCSGVHDSYESRDNHSTNSSAISNSSAIDILCSLLRQYGQVPECFKLLEQKYKSTASKLGKGHDQLELADAIQLLTELVEMHDQSYIILDAMDECLETGQDTGRRNLLKTFNALLALKVPVKIFFSSRFEIDIEEYTGHRSDNEEHEVNWSTINLDPSSTKEDLTRLVDRTIDENLQYKTGCNATMRDQLKAELKLKANGK
jgi:hypothetical protein